MFKKLFGKPAAPAAVSKPSIIGLEIGTSFSVDPLSLRLKAEAMTAQNIAESHIIQYAGEVPDTGDGHALLRFYTDDDAWLQVACEGGKSEENVFDVKLYHYYDTIAVADESEWASLTSAGSRLCAATYTLNNNVFTRVWETTAEEGALFHLQEKTYDADDETPDVTDQFSMLFERPLDDSDTPAMEYLFIAAEERWENNKPIRNLVLSTGIDLSPATLRVG